MKERPDNSHQAKETMTWKARGKEPLSLTRIMAIVLFLSTIPARTMAQENSTLSYYAQMNAIAADGDHAPFWFTANRNAISSVDRMNGYARYGMSYSGEFGKDKSFRKDYG